MNAILTLSDLSISKISETAETGVFMVSDHESNVLANRATLTATGVKPLPKGKMLSVGDDELPQLRDWLYSIMETGRSAPAGKTKRVVRGMSRSENRAAVADAIKAKNGAENPPVKPAVGIRTIGPIEKAADRPAKAKKEEKAEKVSPVEEKTAERTAEAPTIPAEYTSHKRAYLNGRDTKTGARHDRGIWNEWARGVIAAIDGQELQANASKHFKNGYADGSRPLSQANAAWIAGYRSV